MTRVYNDAGEHIPVTVLRLDNVQVVAQRTADKNGFMYRSWMKNQGIPDHEFDGRPIIGIAQSGSDISPCNRIHLELARRVRDGIRDAGGIPMEFPLHPIFENCRRQMAAVQIDLNYVGQGESVDRGGRRMPTYKKRRWNGR
eukprot:gene5415-6739_t